MLFQKIFSLGFIISVCTHCRHDYLKQQWENKNWSCPDHWLRFNGSCYLYSVLHYPVTWDWAQGSCFLEGAQLVEIESAAEQTFLVNQKEMWSISSIPVWIGLHDRETEGTHIWVSTGKVANYTNWGTGEPNDNDGGACVQITNTGLWNDMGCRLKRHYICERPVKWKKLSLSGNAAYHDMAWIRLGDREGYGTHVWYSSGVVSNYTNWGANQPDVVAGQDCVLINLIGLWYRFHCSFTRDYICERPTNVTY